jgi:Asp-tRNA(Asn)/Glu-tRNA(Gln) amidotransferase A subunit family amidase
VSDAGIDAFETHLDALKKAGYDIKMIELFDDVETMYERHYTLMVSEGALAHHKRHEAYTDGYSEELSDRIEQGREETVETLARAREYQETFMTEIREMMAEKEIDLWVCPPALGTAPEGLGDTGDASMNSPWTLAGMPAVSLPGGSVDGLPVGLQVIADIGEDEHLLEWAEEVSTVVANTV